jgi:translation initiation factor 1
MIDIPDSIFPRDELGQAICPRCQKIIGKCVCPSTSPLRKVLLTLDRSGRNGKTVTIIDGLPADDYLLKSLAKKFKVKIGSGGTHFIREGNGVIEIQGDHQQKLPELLKQEGFIC